LSPDVNSDTRHALDSASAKTPPAASASNREESREFSTPCDTKEPATPPPVPNQSTASTSTEVTLTVENLSMSSPVTDTDFAAGLVTQTPSRSPSPFPVTAPAVDTVSVVVDNLNSSHETVPLSTNDDPEIDTSAEPSTSSSGLLATANDTILSTDIATQGETSGPVPPPPAASAVFAPDVDVDSALYLMALYPPNIPNPMPVPRQAAPLVASSDEEPPVRRQIHRTPPATPSLPRRPTSKTFYKKFVKISPKK